jgi:GDPmannose 4,6-dehydratase
MTGARALITGITGQDGATLADLLLDKGYEVYGSARKTSSPWRLAELGIANRVKRVELDLLSLESVLATVRAVRPSEIYNLAGQSTLEQSVREPVLAGELNGLAATRLLEAIRAVDPQIRFFQASSSQLFGRPETTPQSETTPFRPNNPYAIAKLYAHLTTGHYRQAHGLHASAGILFNHESALRGFEFVTRKLTHGLAAFACGARAPIELGDTSAVRDWGHAKDTVRGMWLMLQQGAADDYVLATGETHNVEEFATAAGRCVGLDLVWDRGHDARDRQTGDLVIRTKPDLVRPSDGQVMVGDAGKALLHLGWRPEIDFAELVRGMVEADISRVKHGSTRAEA